MTEAGDDEVTIEGAIALDGVEELAVQVALVVGAETVASARIPEGEFTLALDDGRRVKVERDEQTRVEGLPTTRIRGRWEELEKHAEAHRVGGRAPGPHVRAELQRRVLRPGARVSVRGAVLAREVAGTAAGYRAPGGSVAVTHVLAREIAPAPKVSSARGKVTLPIAQIGGVALFVIGLALFTRWVVAWPASLAHPDVAALRAAAGTTMSFYASLGVFLLLDRSRHSMRLLPQFVRADGEDHTPLESHMVALFAGLAFSILMGLGVGGILETVLAAESLEVRGSKGPLVRGSSIPATFARLGIIAAWVGLWLRERREAKLASLFRDRGSGWKVRSGRIETGSLVLRRLFWGGARSTTTALRGHVEAPLTIRSREGSLRVEPDGLLLGIDPAIPFQRDGRNMRWETGPGTAVAIAGRLDGKRHVRASGPESLLVFATSADDPTQTLRRLLRQRLVVLAIGPVGAILAHLLAYFG